MLLTYFDFDTIFNKSNMIVSNKSNYIVSNEQLSTCYLSRRRLLFVVIQMLLSTFQFPF